MTRIYTTIAIIALALGSLACNKTAAQQKITEDNPKWDCHTMGNKICGDEHRATNVVPCTTDSDCEQKNPAAKEVFLCEAITKAGKRCTRHVPEAGLLCKQHAKMVKEGKVVPTIK